MSTITAKDLTKEYPRSPLAQLDGIPWLPRLIDKVRALNAGKIGAYTPFPCGGDRNFLGTVGVDADALKAEIVRGATDEEIVRWVKAHWAPDAPAKIAEYIKRQTVPAEGEMAGYLQEAIKECAKEQPNKDFSAAKNFSHLICIEENHPYPAA